MNWHADEGFGYLVDRAQTSEVASVVAVVTAEVCGSCCLKMRLTENYLFYLVQI